MSDEVEVKQVYTLKQPLEHAGNEITELRFREATAGDMEDIPAAGATIGDIMRLAARLVRVPYPALKRLKGEDAANVFAITNSFFVVSLPTGE